MGILVGNTEKVLKMLTNDMPRHHKILWLETRCKAMWYRMMRGITSDKELRGKFLHKEIWYKGLIEEIKWWEEWLKTEEARRGLEEIQNPQRILQVAPIIDRLHQIHEKSISILELGAGPFTWIGYKYPGKVLNITAVDALAPFYDRFLKKRNIVLPVPTVFCNGEELLSMFEPESFDFAFANNSLDHSYDPVLIIKNMLTLVKKDRYVILQHYRNEAETANYHGLHQWNFDIAEGDFIVWDKSNTYNMTQTLSREAQVECYCEKVPDYSDKLVCIITKL